jgi:GNAT superfamily N-acetyltransferase
VEGGGSLIPARGDYTAFMIQRWSAAPFRPTDAPEDRPLWQAYHAYRRARAAERAPFEPLERDEVVEHRFLRVRDELLHHRYAVIEDEKIVSFADIAVASPESAGFEAQRHALHLDIGVLEPYRRRSIATNWLSLVREAMNLHGASRIVVSVDEADGHGFARWLGADVARVDQIATCAAQEIDRAALAAWLDDAASKGIRFETIRGKLSPDQRARYRSVADALATEATAGPGKAPPSADPLAALDTLQTLLDVASGEHFIVLACSEEGDALGLADAIWTADSMDRADLLSVAVRLAAGTSFDAQGEEDSLDDPTSSQGREMEMIRTAKGLKASLILALLEAKPGLLSLRSAHRGADQALLGLDDEIGFRTERILTTYTLDYDALDATLSALA